MPKVETKRKPRKRARKRVFIGLDEEGRPPAFPFVVSGASGIHQNGLFAAKRIPKDALVIQYLGERLSKKESNRRGLAQHDLSQESGQGSVYIFELDDKRDIDGNFEWNLARLANHSCEPNSEAQNIDGEIWLVALRTIKKGEEITFDYGYALEHWEDHPCRCGSKRCVGYIVRKEDRKKLAKILRRRARD